MTAVNIIIPPPDIRALVEKTASFVGGSRAGEQFETRLRETERHNVQFSFLQPDDPYNAFYRAEIDRVRLGAAPSRDAAPEPAPEAAALPPRRPQPPKAPAPLQFIFDGDPLYKADLSRIQLTALYVARRGKSFLAQLRAREAQRRTGGESPYAFLEPESAHFSLFTALVDQYRAVLAAAKAETDAGRALRAGVAARAAGLEGAMAAVQQRIEYAAYMEHEKAQREAEAALEREAAAAIDWQDFCVVETVQFTAADVALNLPPAPGLESVRRESAMAERARVLELAGQSSGGHGGRSSGGHSSGGKRARVGS